MTVDHKARISRVALIVADLNQMEEDYVSTFGCAVERRDDVEPSLTSVLGIPRTRGRRSLLRLGRERIELLEFTNPAGRAYPPGSTATDLWFQHMAIVVSDMGHALQRVMDSRRFRPISRRGPVRLPESSGGVTAFKFRDRDGHPLELLAFPDGRGPAEWRGAFAAGPFLGIDHTAIAVSDTDSVAGFMNSVFGFAIGTRTENHGPEQDDLDDIDNVRVSVTQLGPDLPAPRLELLQYHVGPRRPIPRDWASNDIAATHSVMRVASFAATVAALPRWDENVTGNDRVTLPSSVRTALVSGPDAHRFLVEEQRSRSMSVIPTQPARELGLLPE